MSNVGVWSDKNHFICSAFFKFRRKNKKMSISAQNQLKYIHPKTQKLEGRMLMNNYILELLKLKDVIVTYVL